MEIIQSLIDFFDIDTLTNSASIVDLIEFIVLMYLAVFVFISVFRGIVTLCKFK